ncbi:MAG TPA: DUF1043 family protein [Trueperaceae bacterium]|nr:DUF1043 family protein [Trueperaceae bacterium]HRP47418.1 DUF1043 family protein [Trueperaceae bacterium]
MSVWVWVAIAFVVGAVAGWLLANASHRRDPSEQRLRQMRSVLDRLQGEVAQHFQEAGELITRLRSDVESLYVHLERGAAKLTTEDAVQTRLKELEEQSKTSER